MTDNKQQNTESKCTCIEHDPYCCQIHGNCPVCVKPENPEDVVLGHKTSLLAQTMDSMSKPQMAVKPFAIITIEEYDNVEWAFQFNNDNPITIAQPIEGTKELNLTIGNRSNSNMLFYDGKGNTFKIFAREKKL
jgi:hypothetical protein